MFSISRTGVLAALLTVLLMLAMAGSWLFAAGDMKRVTVKADRVVSNQDSNDKTVKITTWSKAIVTQEDSTFTADTVVQHSQNNVHEFTCTGSPVFKDTENTITSDQVVAYSSPRRAEFSGHVKMVSIPKKQAESGNDVKKQMSSDPSTTTCDKMSYDYANKKALATGNVMVVQKERTLWADQGTYDKNQELIVLQGNVRMKNAGKEEIKEMKDADKVTIGLNNDYIDIIAKPNGKIEMIFEVPEDDEQSNPPANTKK